MRLSLIVSAIFLIPASLAGYFTGTDVWTQHRRITTWVAAPATIQDAGVQSRVEGSGKNRRTVHFPVVSYRYHADGIERAGHQVLPLTITGGRAWAQELAGRFSPGQSATAHVNPEDPNQAFLVREYDPEPYGGLLGAALILLVVPWVIVAVSAGLRHRKPGTVPETPGHRLLPRVTVRECARASLFTAMIAFGAAIPVWGHFLSVAPGWDTDVQLSTALIALVLIGLGGMGVYFGRLAGSLDDAHLWIPEPHLTIGRPALVRLSHRPRADLPAESYEWRLACHSIPHKGTPTLVGHLEAPARRDLKLRAGRPIELEQEFLLRPGEFPCSSPAGSPSPHFQWNFEVTVRIPMHPDYRARFLVEVRDAV